MAQQKKIPPKKVASKAVPLKRETDYNVFIFFAAAIVITLLAFSNAFNNDITNWDDVQYVLENDLIRSISWQNIKTIFSTLSVMGNYHPLAVLSLAMDYHAHKLDPHAYHATAIIIHTLNVGLVFLFVQLLVKRPVVAFITALLFGIHPMHVESVAWIAERKDVLYVFFYMASLITYLYYLKDEKRKILFYILTFILFVCAVLSKAQAVTLPLVLLGIDYFKGRKFDMKSLIEKLLFFAFAIGMGLLAVKAQKVTGAIKDVPNNPLYERVFFAGYSFLDYIWKLILPGSLSAYYPYPDKIGLVYYWATAVSIGLIVLVVWGCRNKTILFGSVFYVANIFLLLQLLPVGGAMMADRYSYLCSIGLFFIAGKEFGSLVENYKLRQYKYLFIAVAGIYGCYLFYETHQRNKVWANSGTLWQNVIKQYDNVPIAYNNLGSFYQKHNSLDSALGYFNEALRLKSTFAEALTNRSDIWRVKGDYAKAIADCDTALKADNNYVEAHMNRGIAYCHVEKYDEALNDFNFVAARKTNDPSLYMNRGNLYDMKKKFDSAYSDYSMAIQLDPNNPDDYSSRGRTEVEQGKFKEALADLNTAIGMNATSPTVYYYRSKAYSGINNYNGALQDAMTAKKAGFPVEDAYISDLNKRLQGAK